MQITYTDGTADTYYNTWSSGEYKIVYDYSKGYDYCYCPNITISEWINQKEEKIMKIYEVILVDKVECEILETHKAVGKTPQEAMLDLNLTEETKAHLKKDEYELIFNEKGSFQPVKKDND